MSARVIIQENHDRFARGWDRFHAYEAGTGKLIARGASRWEAQLNARAKGYEEESSLERFQRRGNS